MESNFLKSAFIGGAAAVGLVYAGSALLSQSDHNQELPPMDPKPRHGGDLVAEVLKKHAVEFIFTLSGGHISPILVGCQDRDIKVIDVRHEVNAVFAADAVSRLTNSVGVACVTAGPGLTNTITAVKNAQMAHSPLVLLGGATLGLLKGRGSLQDIDQQALFKSVVKWQATISRVRDIVPTLERAFQIAQSDTPGPVFVELPLDALFPPDMIRAEFSKKLEGKSGLINSVVLWYTKRFFNNLYGGDWENSRQSSPLPVSYPLASDSQIRRARAFLESSRRPVVVLGSQAVARFDKILNLVKCLEQLNVPVFLSGAARGLLGADSEIQYRHKRSVALKKADVVLLLGVAADFRLNYGFSIPSRTPVISANLNSEQLYLNRSPTLAVLGDPSDFLIRVVNGDTVFPDVSSWHAELRELNDKRDAEIAEQAKAVIEVPSGSDAIKGVESFCNPIEVCRALDRNLDANSILVCDGGDFVGTAAYTVKPRKPLSWLDPGAFGTLGVGAGFALAAKLVRPAAQVVLIWGDGSCGYSLMEYDTFRRHNVNVVALCGLDAKWQQIRRDQVKIFKSDVACTLEYSDYHLVAQALGAAAHRVDRDEELDDTFQKAFEEARGEDAKPVFINAVIGVTDFREGSISV